MVIARYRHIPYKTYIEVKDSNFTVYKSCANKK